MAFFKDLFYIHGVVADNEVVMYSFSHQQSCNVMSVVLWVVHILASYMHSSESMLFLCRSVCVELIV